MRLWKLLLIYAAIAVVVYLAIYFVFLVPPAGMPGGLPCQPTIYQPCP